MSTQVPTLRYPLGIVAAKHSINSSPARTIRRQLSQCSTTPRTTSPGTALRNPGALRRVCRRAASMAFSMTSRSCPAISRSRSMDAIAPSPKLSKAAAAARRAAYNPPGDPSTRNRGVIANSVRSISSCVAPAARIATAARKSCSALQAGPFFPMAQACATDHRAVITRVAEGAGMPTGASTRLIFAVVGTARACGTFTGAGKRCHPLRPDDTSGTAAW